MSDLFESHIVGFLTRGFRSKYPTKGERGGVVVEHQTPN